MSKIFDNNQYASIPAEKFNFVSTSEKIHDQKLETKPVGYFQDAMRRFAKNKGSVVAAIIILLLVIFAIVGPFCFSQKYQDSYQTNNDLINYKELLPKIKLFEGTGFWDGTKVQEVSDGRLAVLQGMAIETGYNPIQEYMGSKTTEDVFGMKSTLHSVRIDSYYACSVFTHTFTPDEYKAVQRWQEENGLQVILPKVNESLSKSYQYGRISAWYVSDNKSMPPRDADGNFVFKPAYSTPAEGYDDYASTRINGDPGIADPNSSSRYIYAQRTGSNGVYSYKCRVNAYNYFIYQNGFEPCFAFGSDSNGYDIFSRLSKGARFSFLLAIFVSIVNLTIGAVYGAIEGYYGGAIDLVMERISDILANVPFMVVTILFQLHLAAKVGVVGSLIYAFVLTGWIGMASRVRMQFYRFKNQEYILAARTLGASDARIILKHIFPNSLGTIITGSVLVIPGVIFSETSLSYLGIINLNSSTMVSVGAMLSAGEEVMTSAPHVVLFPSIFIALLMVSFNLFGNGLRDAFNPSLRGSEE